MSTTPDTTSPRRRVLAYDALRAFSILSVVAIHCFMPLRGVLPERSVAMVADDVLHYAVPVFVFISGALLWSRPWRPGPGTYGHFLWRRLTAVGAPYATWALIYLAVSLATAADPAAILRRAPALLLTGHVWYHLYFIPMLLGFYLLTPLAARVLQRSPEATVAVIYLVRIALWPPASAWLHANSPELLWSYATHIATHLPHMALGAWFAMRLAEWPTWWRKSWPALLAAGLAVLTARSLGAFGGLGAPLSVLPYPLGMTATVLGLALAAFELEPHFDRRARVVDRAASLSFGVYFVHPLWLLGLTSALAATGLERLWLEWWAVPVALVMVAAASYATAWALSRQRATAWLVGVGASG